MMVSGWRVEAFEKEVFLFTRGSQKRLKVSLQSIVGGLVVLVDMEGL